VLPPFVCVLETGRGSSTALARVYAEEKNLTKSRGGDILNTTRWVMDEIIYGTRTVAQKFGVSREVIRWIIDSGKLRPKKVNVGSMGALAFGPEELDYIKTALKNRRKK